MMMEDLESRRLLTTVPQFDVPQFQGPRNLGTVESFQFVESELTDEMGVNDSIQTAEVVPLGNLAGQENTVDISGSIPIVVRNPAVTLLDGTIIPATFDADLDVYAFDLQQGDILDISTAGAVTSFTVFNADGSIWFGVDDNQTIGGFYPPTSPLQTVGNAVFAQVVPDTGRYYLAVAPDFTTTTYQLGLRTYRPVVEQLPIGAQQYIFLDMDGGIFPASILDDGTGIPQPGVFRYPSLRDSLNFIGLDPLDDASFNRFIDLTIAEVESHFNYLGLNGNAGDFDQTGVGGDFGVTILNSRDHADPGNNDLVTRIMLGGQGADINRAGLLGISTTIDVGNFGMSDVVFSILDGTLIDGTAVPLSNTMSPLEATALNFAFTISHEAGHSFGLRHTDSFSNTASLIDAGGNIAGDLGVGNDGILGTLDDEDVNFVDDVFAPAEGIVGTNRVLNGLANTLVTGTLGGSATGRVFNDINGNGLGDNDPGLEGITVFVDINGDGVLSAGEPSTQTDSTGSYSLTAPAGTFNVVAEAPNNFGASTSTTQSVVFATSAVATVGDIGFTQSSPNITGTKFADLDGDGIFDDNEPPIEGVFIFLDLDGDDRPDIGEPAARSGADGSFSINYNGTGTFALREVVEVGFQQTLPGADAGFEHQVVLNGSALAGNFNFGNQPTLDFGDAPDTFLTTSAVGGPSHGIVAGLSLGTLTDREVEGQPNADATGDDASGPILITGQVSDDEDGVVLDSPLGLGSTTNLSVTVNNTTGTPAFLQAWMDFDGSGTFEPSERIATNLQLDTGTHLLPVNVPASAAIGQVISRFRYSHTADLGPSGPADTGEVEDHAFTILPTSNVVNDDEFTVARNADPVTLNVFANDFRGGEGLTIARLITNGDATLGISRTVGQVEPAQDGSGVIYTPANGFVGLDEFGYVVRDAAGTEFTARVVVNVTFQTAVPIAVDDIFSVPEGSSNRPLNVLENDVPSLAGGLSIAVVNPGTQGGTLSLIGGNQSISYTPQTGFNGTEQFTYTVVDSAGQFSTATVTINVLPGAQQDDLVEFTIDVLDPVNGQPITNVQTGDFFDVRVSVDDLDNANNPQGVASAFLDLLFTDELVAIVPNNTPNSPFDIQISFGELFGNGFVNIPSTDPMNPAVQQINGQVPGLLNEVGAVQTSIPSEQHTGPAELFTVRMQALAPGIAVFQGDPANTTFAETILVEDTNVLTVSQMRFNSAEVTISSASADFTSAIDDSFPTGVDSLGNAIDSSAANRSVNRFNILANDNLGPSGVIVDHGIVVAPSLGTLNEFSANEFFSDNGTPNDLSDDFIQYSPNLNENGLDEFSYFIQTADGVTSVATVSLAVGNAGADDLVAIDFVLVDTAGNPISSVSTSDEVFGVQVFVEDLRPSTTVFSAFLDVLYDSDIIAPATPLPGGPLDFRVDIANDFNVNTTVGTSVRPGIIDEFGTVLSADPSAEPARNLMATLFFTPLAAGTTTIVGDPADNLDLNETTLFNLNDAVAVSQIQFDSLSVTVTGPQGEFVQNTANPSDVNDNGETSPLDALIVINNLRLQELGSRQGEGAAEKVYVDVSGDGNLTTFDALMVINELSKLDRIQRGFAQAEQVATDLIASSASNPETSSEVLDAAISDLSDKALIGDADVAAASLSSASIAANDDGEDEEDAVLGLLASDLSGLN